jgi:hypothetical protein
MAWDRRLYFPSEGSCATDFHSPYWEANSRSAIQGSLVCSQNSTIRPSPEPNESRPHTLSLHATFLFSSILPSLPGSYGWSLSFTFPTKTLHALWTVVLWVMIPYSIADGYQSFEGTYCLHLKMETSVTTYMTILKVTNQKISIHSAYGLNRFIRKVGNYIQNYTAP